MKEKELEQIFNALSDANRIKILSIISLNEEVCACVILKELNITQPTLTYHMKMLQDAGLVSCHKEGTWCKYKIDKQEFNKAQAYINNLISKEQ